MVAAIHAAYVAGDHDRMHQYVDYRFRLAETVGAAWQEGPEAERARLEALTRTMFVTTLDRVWNANVSGRELVTTVQYAAPDVAWVRVDAPVPVDTSATSHPEQDKPVPFVWFYRLHQTGGEGGQWKVTQREYKVSFARSETGKFFPRATAELTRQLGRTPTLRELNANLPSLQGRIKKRVFKVPDFANPGAR